MSEPTELLPELKQLIDEADDIAARLEDTLHGEDGKLITNLRYKLVDVLKWWPIEDPAPPPQAGADDAETFLKTLPESSVNFGGDLHAAVVDAMEKYARHIAAKAVEDELANRICQGHCGCPDCHVLADKAGYVPVPDTAGLVETENLLGEIGDHIDDFIDNKTSRNETANFIVETAKRYLWKL